MASAGLPKIPKDVDFEEFVAALFQGAGYFVERDLREENILQLDVIVTDYASAPPLMRVLEAKSGDWGFTDIFKIRGWMHYLDVPHGSLVALQTRPNLAALVERAKRLGIDLIHLPDLGRFKERFRDIVPVDCIRAEDLWIWRFAYWLERQMLNRLAHQRKSADGPKRFKGIYQYAYEIHHSIFFAATVSERVERLYELFSQYRNLSARSAVEIAGGDFEAEADVIPSAIFDDTFYKCVANEIQVACWVEHRARLALLKAAVDYALYKKYGQGSKAENVLRTKTGGKVTETPWSSVISFPARFEQALAEISDEPYFHRYPTFWQWFMGAFGGFILKDYEQQELEILSDRTGVPVAEIPRAFEAYDKLFPISGGWFKDISTSKCRILVLFPIPLRGIGANYRRVLHTTTKNWDDLRVTGEHTRADLVKWNNVVVEVLNWN